MDRKSISEQLISGKSKAKGYWSGLAPRTQVLYILFGLAVIFSLTVNVIVKPQRQRLLQAKQELLSVNNRIFELKAQIPDLSQEEFLLEKEQRSLEALKSELNTLESQLPQQDSLPTLLGELVKQSSGYVVDFNLIKPVDMNKSDEYERLNIELRFSSNYAGLVNYLKRLEQISRFITTERIDVVEKKENSSTGLEISLVLSTLLSEGVGPVSKVYRAAQDIQIQPFELKRNPFFSAASYPAGIDFSSSYTLSGIISQGLQPTAIINDDVYKVGDKIGETLIKDIQTNTVTLQEGPLDILLKLNQE